MQNQTPSGFGAATITIEQLYINFLDDRQFDINDVDTLKLELLSKEETYALIGHTKEASVRIPYFDLDSNYTNFDRVRLLQPRSKMKYSQARSSGSHIYFPPTLPWRNIAFDVDIPIIITEGEFKAWQIVKYIRQTDTQLGVIGLAGVTSWTDKQGLHLHKDLMQFKWSSKNSFEHKNRKVYIIFDYDGAKTDGEPNEQVAMAETKLAITLRGLGAEVHLCRVGKFAPVENKKYAIDDHLLNGGNLSEVLTTTSIIMNGVDTIDVKLHEFSTKYAFLNGDVIRLKDGHIMSFQKARIDSAQHIFMSQQTTQTRNGQPKVVVKEIPLIEEYKKWAKRCDLNEVGIYPQYQGLRITPEGKYNHLDDWAHAPVDGDVTPYLEFCQYFFRDEPSFENYWHDWVANVVQYPWRRNYTTPQFASATEGIGKSAIAEFIAEMMGTQDTGPAAIAGPDDLFGAFNGALKSKIFVVINEPSSDRDDHSAKLKNYITSDRISINNKYGAQYFVQNYINFVFTSNKPYITRMGETARREAIYQPDTLTPAESHAKVTALMKWAREQQGFGKVLNWYYNRDISNFDYKAHAPKTATREMAIGLSKTEVEDFASTLRNWMHEKQLTILALTNTQIDLLREHWGVDTRVSHQYLRRALAGIGTVEPSHLIKIDGKPVRHTLFSTTKKQLQNVENMSEVARKTADAVLEEVQTLTNF